MGTHMKTTVEIEEALLRAAKAQARREGRTLRSVIEEGLQTVLQDRRRKRARFRLRMVTVGGKGLRPGLREGDWAQIRDIIYEGRGT